MSPGIDIETDGVSVTSNKISNIFSPALNNSGINLNSAVAPVTHNTISQMGFAITTRGSCAAGSNLQFNTIVGVSTGLSGFSTAAAKTNSFKSVKTIVASGC